MNKMEDNLFGLMECSKGQGSSSSINYKNNWEVCGFADMGCKGAISPKVFEIYCSDSNVYCDEKDRRLKN